MMQSKPPDEHSVRWLFFCLLQNKGNNYYWKRALFEEWDIWGNRLRENMAHSSKLFSDEWFLLESQILSDGVLVNVILENGTQSWSIFATSYF